MAERKGIFKTLSEYDVSKFVKEKNHNSYLPWASCWEIVRKIYPRSYYVIHKQQIIIKNETREFVMERPWFTDGTGWVEVEVHVIDSDNSGNVIEDVSHTEIYPIMDYANKALTEDKITTAEVNKSLKRGLVKAVAEASGLGLHLFYGEDLPRSSKDVEDLQTKVAEVSAKKAKLSAESQKKVAELCKRAEAEANPNLDEDLISGNYRNIEDVEILTNLYANLLAIRTPKKTSKEE